MKHVEVDVRYRVFVEVPDDLSQLKEKYRELLALPESIEVTDDDVIRYLSENLVDFQESPIATRDQDYTIEVEQVETIFIENKR